VSLEIHQITDLDNKIIEILKSGISRDMFSSEQLAINYLYEYRNTPGNLFYILDHGRYNTGKYFVLTDNDRYIASAGWNHYSDDTALLLTRMLVIPEYRGSYILAKTVLQHMIDQSLKYKNQWITFNEYNLTLYKWFERVEQGKRGALFNNWPEIYARFRPIGQKEINHTLQYVVELKNK
jgi:hypothetical protein